MDVVQAPGTSNRPHPIGRDTHLKRVSLLIQSKKYQGQVFVGYALLHEFNPKRLSFFTSQKFPIDEILEVDVDFFGAKAHMKVRMANIHEQISSGRVMNAVPNEENPFPVRKFYRCYAVITSMLGNLPNTVQMDAPPGAAGEAGPQAVEGQAASPDAPAAAAGQDAGAPAAAAADAEPAVANAGDSLVSPSDRPADADDIAAKLAALSAATPTADTAPAADAGPVEEKQAA